MWDYNYTGNGKEKKRRIVISKNKCHVSYFGGLKDSHLLTQLIRGHQT